MPVSATMRVTPTNMSSSDPIMNAMMPRDIPEAYSQQTMYVTPPRTPSAAMR